MKEIVCAHMASRKAVGNKSAFVRSLPADMPAADVVAKGKEQGMALTPAYVYAIRTASRRRESEKGFLNGAAPGVKGDGKVESLLRALAAEIGLSRAIAVLEEEQKRVRRMLA